MSAVASVSVACEDIQCVCQCRPLLEYYEGMRLQLNGTFVASIAIHSRMVRNDKMTKGDYVAKAVKGTGRTLAAVPFASLAGSGLSRLIKARTAKQKALAVRRLACLLPGAASVEKAVEEVARSLALARSSQLVAAIEQLRTGLRDGAGASIGC